LQPHRGGRAESVQCGSAADTLAANPAAWLGLSPQRVMRGFKEWAETYMDEVLANREEYDTRA
jgi:hypothetical protein